MVSSMTALLIIAVTALFTFLTRAFHFYFFGAKKLLLRILFLGRVLPPATSPFWLSTVCEILPRQRLPLESPKSLRF